MSLAQALEQRYSCRSFRSDPVPRPVIAQILDIAQRTPSWTNAQPWQVFVTGASATEKMRLALALSPATADEGFDFKPPAEYAGVYQTRRRECGLALYASVGIQRGDREASARQAQENFRFFGAPHVAIVTTARSLGVYGAVDCGAYVNNFMLVAASLGVSTIAQAALAKRTPFFRQWLSIPDDQQVVCGISFGYEDSEHPVNRFRTSRASRDEVCRWVD